MTGSSGISWSICKSSAPHSRQIIMPASHHPVFTGRMPFLPPNKQHLGTEDTGCSQGKQSHLQWSLICTSATDSCLLYYESLCASIIHRKICICRVRHLSDIFHTHARTHAGEIEICPRLEMSISNVYAG